MSINQKHAETDSVFDEIVEHILDILSQETCWKVIYPQYKDRDTMILNIQGTMRERLSEFLETNHERITQEYLDKIAMDIGER